VNEVRDGTTTTLGRRFLSPLLGRPRLQPFFRHLHEVALADMGYGEGGNPATSGEEAVLDYVQSSLGAKERVTVFDVGANVGEYADQVLVRWGDRVDLRCFEPSPSTYRILSERLAGRPNVTLENLGLSDRNDSVMLHTRGAGSKVASVHASRPSREDEELDVEGHELSLLPGARAMLGSEAIRFIQFETGVPRIDARVFFRDFWEALGQEIRPLSRSGSWSCPCPQVRRYPRGLQALDRGLWKRMSEASLRRHREQFAVEQSHTVPAEKLCRAAGESREDEARGPLDHRSGRCLLGRDESCTLVWSLGRTPMIRRHRNA
jgi:hypothetical protein